MAATFAKGRGLPGKYGYKVDGETRFVAAGHDVPGDLPKDVLAAFEAKGYVHGSGKDAEKPAAKKPAAK